MFSDLSICISCAVSDFILFDFGNAGVRDDVYFVVLELLLGVFADFFVICVENMGLRLDDMY